MDAIEFSKQPKGVIWRMEPGELHHIIEESADEIERLRHELAVTIKAKQENDERFMTERDQARQTIQDMDRQFKGIEAEYVTPVSQFGTMLHYNMDTTDVDNNPDGLTHLELFVTKMLNKTNELREEICGLERESGEKSIQILKGNEALLQGAVHMAMMRESLEAAYPALPSYFGQFETKDNPCPRRKADVVLALPLSQQEQLFSNLKTAAQKLRRRGLGGIPDVLEAVSALERL